MHRPVLLQQTIELLDVHKDLKYIDATAGEGGHLEGLLKKGALVLAIDRDQSQIDALKKKFKDQSNLVLDTGNFAVIDKIAEKNNFFPVHGIIFDLGLSMTQLTDGGKGLSFKRDDEYLDMRLDESCETDARTIINTYDKSRLYDLFAKNAEENNSLAISSSIVRERAIKKIETVGDLKKVLESALGTYDQRTVTRIFQALRIEVNNEFDNIRSGLQGGAKILARDGRIAVITFHSVEDRIVKQCIKKYGFRQITKKVVIADSDATYERSAKLRVFKKNETVS